MSQIMKGLFFSSCRHALKSSSVVAVVVLLTACSNNPQPKMYGALQAAETAIADADRNGVNGYPSPELVEARNKLQQARAAIEMEQMPLAVYLAQESQVNAELASAKATLIKEQQVNDEIKEGIEVLKQEMDRNMGAGS
ncbi:MAG: DUF4398 domain-containing protein [Gammaproteobacteria bacterium]|uniref:DUF4398 domain-containing protein n=2 Tax=unclassified Marinomonas TaxID=196814 RepID=UPI000C1DD123|nr:DUF4398 domain-containing protein [Marinomonas sp. BSi20584]MBU1295346.1 DUF4398 domain-containing protein [Gammaproteobacteria bacterium]MBU1465991.1 DUF4398 domain-containing protein [Gammaproteobacteria bacterium]MBU2022905.1 DUF4398 domain-containing protein [Gammaproteobacteria bacterium]MBU2238618.1 DUF4398 domain-containing protein [Gammaproteobacteria bacterium]MBU2318900.1 DUF4398 domain-containing protein [Gammaproteobacteria bacterium]